MVRERAREGEGPGEGEGGWGGGKGAGREEEEQNRVRRGVQREQGVKLAVSECVRIGTVPRQSPATTTSTDGASERRCYIRHGTTASARYFIPSSLSPRNLQQP